MKVTWTRSTTAIALSTALALGSGLAMAQSTPSSNHSTSPSSGTTMPAPAKAAPGPSPSGSTHPSGAAAQGSMNSSHSSSASDKQAKAGHDMQLSSKVKAELAKEDLKGDDISVTAKKNGEVTLKGHVDSKSDVTKAKEAAQKVAGVHQVDTSGLKVQ